MTNAELSDEVIQQKRNELGLKKGDFVIGNIARLVEVKDHSNLIKAFSLLGRKVLQTKLVIVGDGPLKDSLKLKVKSLRLEDRVKFLSERQDISELLNVFDVFVLSSKNEGLSLTLLEAMAVKKPVVATSVGGNKEIIKNGKDGYLIPSEHPQRLAEAILDIAKNPRRAERIANSAYQKVKTRYNLEKMVAEYQRVYEQALQFN